MKRPYEVVILSKGDFARTVRIYAPKKADRAVIMHDGQNVFLDSDASYGKSWRAIDVLKEINVKNTAIVGIDSIDATRMDDYTTFPSELDKYGVTFGGGKAHVYSDYIEQTVLPYLDKRFGFEFYGMLGSSAGALATIDFAARKNKRFKAYGMFSTPIFVSPAAYGEFFNSASFDPSAAYYVYVGGSESEDAGEFSAVVPQAYVDSAFLVTNVLRKSGAKNIDLMLKNTAIHDEVHWRVPEKEFLEMFSKL